MDVLPDEIVVHIMAFCTLPTMEKLWSTNRKIYSVFHDSDTALLKTEIDQQREYHKKLWTWDSASFRSWYQLCDTQYPTATMNRMTKYQSTIHPKLFYLYQWKATLESGLRRYQSRLITYENQITHGSSFREVVIVTSELFQMHVWLLKLNKFYLREGVMSDSVSSWMSSLMKGIKEGAVKKSLFKRFISGRCTLVLLYQRRTKGNLQRAKDCQTKIEALSKDLSLRQFSSYEDCSEPREVLVWSLSKPLSSQEKEDNQWVRPNGHHVKPNIIVSLCRKEIRLLT